MSHQRVAVHEHFKATAQSQTRRRSDHRYGRVFKRLDRSLEASQKGIHTVKITRCDEGQKRIQVHTSRIMLSVVVHKDARTMILGGCSHNLHRLISERVCLGVKLDQSQVAFDGIQAGRRVLEDRRVRPPGQLPAHNTLRQINRRSQSTREPNLNLNLACICCIERRVTHQARRVLKPRIAEQSPDLYKPECIDHLERSAHPVESELHRVINRLR